MQLKEIAELISIDSHSLLDCYIVCKWHCAPGAEYQTGQTTELGVGNFLKMN